MTAILGATSSRLLNRFAYAMFNKATALTAVAGDDRIPVSDTSADGETKYMTAADLLAGSGMVETVTATNVLTASESGKTFFLDAAAGFLTTLPAPAAGLKFTFFVKTAPTSNGYTLAPSGGTADIICAGFNELEVDTGDDGPYIADGDTITFVANTAVVGDYVEMTSDGTSWYVRGQANADGGITLTKAA